MAEYDANGNLIGSYDASGNYDVKLLVYNVNGPDSIVKIGHVTFVKPSAPIVNGDTLCSSGPANLTATSSGGTLVWLDSNDVQVGTGALYAPSITENVDYYVQEQFNPTPVTGGPSDNLFGAGGNFTGDQHLVFDCFKPTKLTSVKVYAQGNGNRTIELRDSDGIVLQSVTTFIGDGERTVTLNFDIPIGTELQLGTAASGSPDMRLPSEICQQIFRSTTRISLSWSWSGSK